MGSETLWDPLWEGAADGDGIGDAEVDAVGVVDGDGVGDTVESVV